MKGYDKNNSWEEEIDNKKELKKTKRNVLILFIIGVLIVLIPTLIILFFASKGSLGLLAIFSWFSQ